MTGSKAVPARGGEPELRSVGLKATLPRMQVLDIFRQSSSRHLHAEDVFRLLAQRRAEVGLATVYRVLSQLEAAGLLLRQTFESGKAVFELNEGPHHDHLICLQCGRVDEFSNEHIEALQRQVARDLGYRLADHRLALYGHCGPCRQVPAGAPPQAAEAPMQETE
ncbi:Ferric uptake regulation protein [Delftia tsuruhatensis]|uniref:ferric iron uptake transcriptional regulator n=1 Tax=Delftia tsuruhatensis TaxID=180282 RepID=UPI001E7F982B|nr:ferric iron uptake transcriptional regulator [Delftia tsuruhatensis]CAB5669033.1 Ferric uptake regulation protein [Delftia tsuruhatensis]CAC9682713.1 Ferric uptake regulation protein [Delftia tsuruhatensis]